MANLKKGNEVVTLKTKGAIDAFVNSGWKVVGKDKKSVTVRSEDNEGDKVEVRRSNKSEGEKSKKA